MISRAILFISLIFIAQGSFAIDRDYPKSHEERKIDEMGSLAGGEGLVFRPSKIKNQSTKATVADTSVNKYLWKAALEVIKDMPLMSADAKTGLIITDWYSSPDMPKYSYKVDVFIKDDVISPESIEVKVFERSPKSKEVREAKDLQATFEDKILRKSRELYIKSERK